MAELNADKAQKNYTHHYNLRARDKEFDIGDMVLVLMPDSTHKVLARWKGPGTITAKLSPYSYRVALNSGAVRTLHVNDLRRFIPRVASVGVIFEDDSDFDHIEYCYNPRGVKEVRNAVKILDLSHLLPEEQIQLRTLIDQR